MFSSLQYRLYCKIFEHRGIDMKYALSGLVLALGMTASTAANATVFAYDIVNPPGSDNAGDVTHFGTTYDDVTQQLTWTSTVARNLGNGNLAKLTDVPIQGANVVVVAVGTVELGTFNVIIVPVG